MSVLKWFSGSRKPNITRLRQAGDVDGLVAALNYQNKDPDASIQIMAEAARALGALGRQEAVPALEECLQELRELDKLAREMLEAHGKTGPRFEYYRDLEKIIEKTKAAVLDALANCSSETLAAFDNLGAIQD